MKLNNKRVRKITNQVFKLVDQPLAVFRSLYKIPDGFWLDPFVLGFLSVIIVNATEYIHSKSKLSPEEFALVVHNNFQKLSFWECMEMEDKFMKLIEEQPLVFGDVPKKADFKLGLEYGQVATSLLLGVDELVVKWRIEDILDELDDYDLPEDHKFIKIKILNDLFVIPLVEHFELGDKPDILTLREKTRNLSF